MFFDLNIPVPSLGHPALSKKGQGKSPQQTSSFNTAQLGAIEARVDLLIHCQ
jgi:hypothetical protein